jgi:hypothetical protein
MRRLAEIRMRSGKRSRIVTSAATMFSLRHRVEDICSKECYRMSILQRITVTTILVPVMLVLGGCAPTYNDPAKSVRERRTVVSPTMGFYQKGHHGRPDGPLIKGTDMAGYHDSKVERNLYPDPASYDWTPAFGLEFSEK